MGKIRSRYIFSKVNFSISDIKKFEVLYREFASALIDLGSNNRCGKEI